ncbi:MAG: hypothetical protein WAU84_06105, partial [Thermoguttaceae bacterium]
VPPNWLFMQVAQFWPPADPSGPAHMKVSAKADSDIIAPAKIRMAAKHRITAREAFIQATFPTRKQT